MATESLKWDPQYPFRPQSSVSCQKPPQNFSLWASWIESCDENFQTKWSNPLVSAVGALSIRLEVFDHPYARPVLFHLPQGLKVKGLLGLKNDGIKRPLVIFRSGIFSSVSEALPERYFFLQLFEESPFHFLLLESSTGPEFIERNTSFSMGGFDEGLQNYLIAQGLTSKAEPISEVVSSVHLSSLSLGGHGTFFAAILNAQKGQKIFSSFSSYCPLLEFQKTFQFHETQKLMMHIMDAWSRMRLAPLIEKYKIEEQNNFVRAVMDSVAQNYTQPLVGWPQLKFPSELQLARTRPGSSSDLFWAMNDFSSQIVKITDPFLIFASLKDPIVPVDINIGRVWNREYGEVPSNIQVARLQESYHCSLPVTYDWQNMGALIREFILRNSEGFVLGDRKKNISLKAAIPVEQIRIVVSSSVMSSEQFVVQVTDSKNSELAQVSFDLKELGYAPAADFSSWSERRKQAYGSLLQRWVNANLRVTQTRPGVDYVLSWRSP